MKTKEAYPVFIKPDGNDYLVYIPDWDIYTEGHSCPDAIAMARDAIGAKWGCDVASAPEPSSPAEAIKKAKAEADKEFDFSDGLLTLVDIDVIAYNERLRQRTVRKNCTIPYWLNKEAEERGINFSRVLQEALLELIEA